MTQELDLLRTARADLQARVEQIGADQWDLPTPCDDWTVRDLVAHLTAGNQMSVDLLNGATVDEAVARLQAAAATDNPVGDFIQASDAQEAAFAEDGAMERICHHRLGDMPGAQIVGLRLTDLSGHAWDLSRALGIDETLPQDVVEAVWERVQPLAPILPATGMFAEPQGDLADDASTQDKLLHTLGRKV